MLVGMDVAASEFKVEGQDCYELCTWYLEGENYNLARKMTGEQLAELYARCSIGMGVAASEFQAEDHDCCDLATWYPGEKLPTSRRSCAMSWGSGASV